jgi:hypothetical protein
VTPIFVRPVREQLEHDRLIRFLQARYKRKFEVAINTGEQQLASVKLGTNTFFPDLILTEGKKLAVLVEVESSESTNNLEAMAQWTHFSRARVPFHLYVPVLMVDAAKRLCDANQVSVSEIWTYRAVNDQFDLVRVFHDPNAVKNGNKLAPKIIQFAKVVPPPPPPPAPEPVPEPVKPVVVAKPLPGPRGGIFVKSAPKPVPPAKVAAPTTPAKPVASTKVVAPPAAAPKKSAVPVKPVKPVKAAAAAKTKSAPAKPVKKAAKKAPAKPVAKSKPKPKPKAKPGAKKRK